MQINRRLNSFIDWILGARARTTLNGDRETTKHNENVAAELVRALRALLSEVYDPTINRFDYARAQASAAYRDLRDCTARLNGFQIESLACRAERLAFWINLYNALVVNAVIEFGVRVSVMLKTLSVMDFGFFRRAAYCIGGLRFSADDIEHGILRGNRAHPIFQLSPFAKNDPRLRLTIQPLDARIHFALNCASRSCPPIAAYGAEQLDAQLHHAMRAFVNNTTQIDATRAQVTLSPIFRWYAGDFGGKEGILNCVQKTLDDELARAWLAANRARVRLNFSRYDWLLNG